MHLLATLLAFSWLPVSHAPRPAPQAEPGERPFWIADVERLGPVFRLPYEPRETSSPVVDDAQTRLYVGTSDGTLRCRFRGKGVWSWRGSGSILAAPLVAGDELYLASADGLLTDFDRFSGKVKWQTNLKEELTTQPTLSEGKLFVMSSEESITALDAASGKSLWKYHRDPPAGFTLRGNARPRAAHGLIYAGFADGMVAALNPADGSVRWTRAASGTGEYLDVDGIEAPETGDRVFAASARAGVVALDAQSGQVVWSAPLPGANHVLVEGGRIIAGGRGALVALDRATGKQLWRLELGADQYPTQPASDGALLLVAIERGKLLAVDSRTGNALGAYDPGSGFSSAATVVPGAAFLLSNGGSLVSLGLLP